MRNRPRTAHFGQQAITGRSVVFEFGREELQGDRLAEFQIVGAIHFAHAAAPQQRDDAVAVGENVARREAAEVERA